MAQAEVGARCYHLNKQRPDSVDLMPSILRLFYVILREKHQSFKHRIEIIQFRSQNLIKTTLQMNIQIYRLCYLSIGFYIHL